MRKPTGLCPAASGRSASCARARSPGPRRSVLGASPDVSCLRFPCPFYAQVIEKVSNYTAFFAGRVQAQKRYHLLPEKGTENERLGKSADCGGAWAHLQASATLIEPVPGSSNR